MYLSEVYDNMNHDDDDDIPSHLHPNLFNIMYAGCRVDQVFNALWIAEWEKNDERKNNAIQQIPGDSL